MHAGRASHSQLLLVDQPLDELAARRRVGVEADTRRLAAARRGQSRAEHRRTRWGEAAHLEQRPPRAHGYLAWSRGGAWRVCGGCTLSTEAVHMCTNMCTSMCTTCYM